jgi:hypothetical protein
LEPITTAAVAILELAMVKHPFLTLAAMLAFTTGCFIADNRHLDDVSRRFTTLITFPVLLVYGNFGRTNARIDLLVSTA